MQNKVEYIQLWGIHKQRQLVLMIFSTSSFITSNLLEGEQKKVDKPKT